MDKEIKEIMDNLKEIQELLKNSKACKVKDAIHDAFNEPATISIKKDADGKAKTHIEGTNLAVLITLAGLEKCILEKLDAPNGLWEAIKSIVGTMKVGKNG